MALQMATNITPDVFSGVGGEVFDATEGLEVSWQVNGSSPMTAYQIVIQSYDENSTQLYTTGKVALSQPFYGTNYKGNVQFFEAIKISASALAGAGISNGNSYKMVITQWWGETDAQSVTQNSAAIIEAWSHPTLVMGEISSPIASRKNVFTATFNQAQGDSINWIRWQIAQNNDYDNLLYDSGNIYGTSELKMEYDGFFTGLSYAVQCSVQTQSGQEVSTGWILFEVEYAIDSPNGKLNAEVACNSEGVAINWSSARNIEGIGNGPYDITNGRLNIDKGSTVVWNTANGIPIQIAKPYTIVWKGHPRSGNNNTVLFEEKLFSVMTSNGLVEVSIRNSSSSQSGLYPEVFLKINGSVVQTIRRENAHLDRWWLVVLTPNEMKVLCFEETGGLYPESTLYPSDLIFPRDSSGYTGVLMSTTLPSWQGELTDAVLYGPQTTEYLWILRGVIDTQTLNKISFDFYYEPAWDERSYLLATFQDGLSAGNIKTNGYALYRRNILTGEYMHLIDVGVDVLSVMDYGAKNQNAYEYQLYYSDDTTFTASPMTSQTVTPCKWNWSLFACTQDEDNVYHVQRVFAFGCNVESGNVTNNNTPSMQKTFTPYPNYQPDAANYRSGTLKALIGVIDKANNQYVEKAEQLDALNQLCISDFFLFLKDRKGNMYMVKTGGAVQATVHDAYPNQATTIQLPWVEVGDASDAVLIALDEDGAYDDTAFANQE